MVNVECILSLVKKKFVFICWFKFELYQLFVLEAINSLNADIDDEIIYSLGYYDETFRAQNKGKSDEGLFLKHPIVQLTAKYFFTITIFVCTFYVLNNREIPVIAPPPPQPTQRKLSLSTK